MSPLLSAFLVGLGVALYPCTLAGHLAAFSALCALDPRPSRVVIRSVGLIVGFCLTLCVLVLFLSWGAVKGFSSFQSLLDPVLGPLLLLAGLIITGCIPLGRFQPKLERLPMHSLWGAALVGALLALTLCPAAAAWIFFVLIPQALHLKQTLATTLCFGLGLMIPLSFALLFSAFVSRLIPKSTIWLRLIPGLILIALGLWRTALWALT
jgi:hypothetical protein